MTTNPEPSPGDTQEIDTDFPERASGIKLLSKLVVYHLILASVIIFTVISFPDFANQLPIGGLTELVGNPDDMNDYAEVIPAYDEDIEIVSSVFKAASDLDRLGYARKLIMVLVGLWLLMLPVSWVHKGIHQVNSHDHSMDETMLVLPGVVASIVLVVQHSLALAFSLAGIVAGVQFRRALQDTFDALFILVAIGSGIAAGVSALEITAILTLFFTYATYYVYFFGDGLESDHAAQRKALKALRKKKKAEERLAQQQEAPDNME
jgi:hypothetical protein